MIQDEGYTIQDSGYKMHDTGCRKAIYRDCWLFGEEVSMEMRNKKLVNT